MSRIIHSNPNQVINGPKGIRLELDASEIFPDDPGMGTPRLVWVGKESMTLDCAMDNVGEIIPDAKTFEDAKWAYDWLKSLSDDADKWLDCQYKLKQK